MRALPQLIAHAFMFLMSVVGGAAETWLVALGERDEHPEWGAVQLHPTANWEELKDGSGGLTLHGMITIHARAMFGQVRVAVAPLIADLTRAKNSAMHFAKPPQTLPDVLETLLAGFDTLDGDHPMVATVQILLSAAPFGTPGPSSNISDVECVRLAIVKGGRKSALIELTQSLRERHASKTGETLPDAPGMDGSDEAMAAYWRNTLLKRFAGQIEQASCNAKRGLLIFEIRNGVGDEFKSALARLDDFF
jgi:hypothetical protein